MRKIDVLYDNLSNLLLAITYDNATFIAYHDGKDLASQDILVTLADSIIDETEKISEAKGALEFVPDFSILLVSLEEFDRGFGEFVDFRKNEIQGIIAIIQKLSIEFAGTGIDLEETINETEFDLLELTEQINMDNFFVFDNLNYRNSLLLFNLSNVQNFKLFVDEITAGAQVLFYLLTKIGQPASTLNNSKYVLVDSNFIAEPKTVWATLCLHIVKSGATIHRSYEYQLPPRFSSSSIVTLGNKYQQFIDTIDIISEYNYQKDILDKYLRIYHVFENFMYKAPLVKLETDANGEVFSIRDFKRMYDKINDGELNMLKKLFERILIVEHSPGLTYTSKILVEWTGIIPTYFANDVNLNILLRKLNVTTTKGADISHNNVNIDNVSHFLSKLIYCIRNSIVHNRETEFHLTHLNLISHPTINDTAKVLLEKFLIPILEELVFSLITVRNGIVWYDQSKLTLWKEV